VNEQPDQQSPGSHFALNANWKRHHG